MEGVIRACLRADADGNHEDSDQRAKEREPLDPMEEYHRPPAELATLPSRDLDELVRIFKKLSSSGR